jgi:hypothetical protein
MTKMKFLDLDGTRVTGSGLKNLRGLPVLEELSLEFNEISADGLVVLGECQQLRLLRLSRLRVSDEGIKRLQATLPNCKIDCT